MNTSCSRCQGFVLIEQDRFENQTFYQLRCLNCGSRGAVAIVPPPPMFDACVNEEGAARIAQLA